MRLKVTSVKVKTGLSKALNKASTLFTIKSAMSSIGHKGLRRLINDTPSRSGKTASSWDMEVEKNQNGYTLYYSNSNKISDGTPLVVLIVNGHGTGTGGYVPANNFVTPIVDSVVDEILREVENIIE